MGCDIHAYIDYDDFKARDGDWWVSCFADRVRFGRNYTLFTLMAGVRYDPRIDKYHPLFGPRGLPDRLSWSTEREYGLRVTESEALADAEGYCSVENASEWTKSGHSVWLDDEHTTISCPDWHSASWLTVEELEKVKEAYESIEVGEIKTYTVPKTFDAIIAAMKELDGETPGRSRLVFWFDG